MRLFLLALAALLTIAAPASAQTQLADSSGAFVGIDQLSFGSGQRFSLDATAGYRYQSGVDVGLRAAMIRPGYSTGTSIRLAPSVGYTQPLALGSLGRVQATAEYTSLDRSYNSLGGVYEGQVLEYGSQSIRAELAASVSRPVRVAGSMRFHPTVGGYATAIRAFDLTSSDDARDLRRVTALRDQPSAFGAGVDVSLPLTFRLFGADAALIPSVRFELAGDAERVQRDVGVGAGNVSRLSLRLNF